MKNRLILPLFLLLAFACSKNDDENTPVDGYDRVYPLLVVNKGKHIPEVGMGSVCRYTVNNNKYKGDIYGGAENTGMGGETTFATLWQDTLYVVSKHNNTGNALSAYNNKTGAYLKGYKTEEGIQASSFVAINNKIGILSTSGAGALIIDMATLTKRDALKGTSTVTGDMIVCENYLYIIDNQERILIYPLTDIETATPKVIEKAIGGFSVGKNGTLWAYYNDSSYDSATSKPIESPNSSFIKINTSTAQEIGRVPITIPILKSFMTYYPGLTTASVSENALFFIKSAEVASPILYKYDIHNGVTENFYTLTNNESFKNIVYNPSNNTVSAIAYRLENDNYSIVTIDATSGKLKQRHNCYSNLDAQNRGVFLVLNVR